MSISEPTIYFKTNLRFLRKKFNVSQEELALQVNKRSSTISNWEMEVSQPDAKDLVAICQFFGVSLDAIMLVDLIKGNLITEEHVGNFKAKGNLNSNLMGNVNHPHFKDYSHENTLATVANDRDETGTWAVLKLLKEMDGKLDVVRDAVIKGASKKK